MKASAFVFSLMNRL